MVLYSRHRERRASGSFTTITIYTTCIHITITWLALSLLESSCCYFHTDQNLVRVWMWFLALKFKKLIGTAISIQSSAHILYPSISVCTAKPEIPLHYFIHYRHPNNSWITISPSLKDLDNRAVTYRHDALWEEEEDFSVRVDIPYLHPIYLNNIILA